MVLLVSKRKPIHSSGHPLVLLNSNLMGPDISSDEEPCYFMKYFLSIIAIAFLLISCGHGITLHFPKDKKLTNPAEIIIVRNKNLVCGGQSTKIFLDGLDIAQLRIGEYVSVLVEPGVHHVRAVPFFGSGREFSDNFEEGKKHYLLISLFDMGDYSFSETLFSALTGVGHGCDFEIEKISEEKGLKRIKRSKNLIEMEKAPEKVAEVIRTESESEKIACAFNPKEPWTGTWDVVGYRYWSGQWALKQIDNKVVWTKQSAHKIEGLVGGDQLKGKIIKPRTTYPFTVEISSDGQYFTGTSTDYFGRGLQIRGTRRK
jgi:hypothetical protein